MNSEIQVVKLSFSVFIMPGIHFLTLRNIGFFLKLQLANQAFATAQSFNPSYVNSWIGQVNAYENLFLKVCLN